MTAYLLNASDLFHMQQSINGSEGVCVYGGGGGGGGCSFIVGGGSDLVDLHTVHKL